MGSYDVGLFILNNLGQKFGKENIGQYRDDGLAIMKNKSARLADKTRKLRTPQMFRAIWFKNYS